MTRARRLIFGSLALVTFGALTSCSGETIPPATASASATTATTTQATRTPEQVAADAATTAFTQLLRVTDAAAQDPLSRDWEPEIRRYAADPAAYAAVQSVRNFATLGLRQVGDSQVQLRVTDVNLSAPSAPTLSITGCFDSQSTHVVHSDTGEPVPHGTPPHYVWEIAVTQYQSEPGQPWLVNVLQPRTDRPC